MISAAHLLLFVLSCFFMLTIIDLSVHFPLSPHATVNLHQAKIKSLIQKYARLVEADEFLTEAVDPGVIMNIPGYIPACHPVNRIIHNLFPLVQQNLIVI